MVPFNDSICHVECVSCVNETWKKKQCGKKIVEMLCLLWLPIDGGWQFPFRKMDSMNLQKEIGISSSEHKAHTFCIHLNIPMHTYAVYVICLHHA